MDKMTAESVIGSVVGEMMALRGGPNHQVEAVCAAIVEHLAEIRSVFNDREELREAIAYAHGRLDPECWNGGVPPNEGFAQSLRKLADERAGWIEVAIDHNKQCKQLNPGIEAEESSDG